MQSFFSSGLSSGKFRDMFSWETSVNCCAGSVNYGAHTNFVFRGLLPYCHILVDHLAPQLEADRARFLLSLSRCFLLRILIKNICKYLLGVLVSRNGRNYVFNGEHTGLL